MVSGLSGILVGIYALLGAFYAYTLLEDKTVYIRMTSEENVALVSKLLFIAFLVALFATLTAIFLTRKKAIDNNEKIWDLTTK